MTSHAGHGEIEGRLRIADAAVRCIVRVGIDGASMSAIAAEGGVSKALLHYHFADRAQLLAHVVGRIADRLGERERAARMDSNHTDATVVDALWHLTDDELRRGELRALLELGTLHDPVLDDATHRARQARHDAAVRTVDHVLMVLDLTPRVPVELIAGAAMSLADGLAIGNVPPEAARPSFDVFWLAILSLCD